jgi:tmRNA-binding protein
LSDNFVLIKMSAARKMDMRKFFAVVKKKEMHLANLQVQHFRDEEKAEVEAEERKEREIEIASGLYGRYTRVRCSCE